MVSVKFAHTGVVIRYGQVHEPSLRKIQISPVTGEPWDIVVVEMETEKSTTFPLTIAGFKQCSRNIQK